MSPTTTRKPPTGNRIAYSQKIRQQAIDEGLALVAVQVLGFRFIGAIDFADARELEDLARRWHRSRLRERRTLAAAAKATKKREAGK